MDGWLNPGHNSKGAFSCQTRKSMLQPFPIAGSNTRLAGGGGSKAKGEIFLFESAVTH
jgi:hypothetical protein